MATEINPGDRVEVIRVSKGSFYRGRYKATVIGQTNGRRIKVRDDQAK